MSRQLAVAAAGIALAVLAPIVLWGLVVRTTVVDDLARREAEQRAVTAQIAGASIDRELRAAGDALTLFGTGPTLREALRARSAQVLDRRLGELLRGRANSLGAVLDPTGIVLAAPLARELAGQDFSHRDYFGGAMSSAGPFVSEIFASATAGNPSVVAVSAAIREGDATLGVAVLTLAPADMLDLLRPLRQVEGRELVILDARGRVVAATDPALRPLAPIGAPRADRAPSGEPIEFAGRQRVVTTASVSLARWSLYVVDDPAVVGSAWRQLEAQLVTGAAATAALALGAAVGIAWLYATALRQRAALADREAALARANAELAVASRHKSEFLAGMSHELRTPLNAILGFSDLLEEQLAAALSERQRRYLRNIRDAGEHLLALINDVLDLSKVEAGKVELRPEVVSIAALLEPVIASSRETARARDVSFDVRVPAGERAVVVDVGRCRQILFNLLSNAVKFTPAGGSVTLDAALDRSDLAIEVADTGIGIPAGKRDRVFGAFERLHEGRSEASGTGLGLALTKELVELLSGTIRFESEEGHGTTFRVRLPCVLAAVSVDRVLVVEDEQRDAELIVALAAKAGLQSEVVRSVAAARAAIRRAPPTAVVLDLRLPDGRGEDVLEQLKDDAATRHVSVVVVTVEDDDRRSRVLGADDHLTKPIDHARLDGWLRRIAVRGSRKEEEEVLAGTAGG